MKARRYETERGPLHVKFFYQPQVNFSKENSPASILIFRKDDLWYFMEMQ